MATLWGSITASSVMAAMEASYISNSRNHCRINKSNFATH